MGAREIVAGNIAGIVEARLPAPLEGGVVLLAGENGAGKSHLLRALQAHQTGKAKGIPVRDGEPYGWVEGLGRRLTIAARANIAGELEVEHLDGLDPGALVSPGIEKPEAADAERIRQVCLLVDPSRDAAPFRALVGDDAIFETIVREDSLAREHLPAIADAVKRDLEKGAREMEAQAGELQTRAQGLSAALPADLPEEPVDRAAIGAALEARVSELSALRQRAQTSAQALNAAAEARRALEAFGDTGTDADVAQCEKALAEATAERRDLEAKLQAARGAEAIITREVATAIENRARRAAAQRSVDAAAGVEPVEVAAVAQAERALADARSLAERAAVIEKGQRDRTEARAAAAKAGRAQELGLRLRTAARGCENVVSAVLASVCPAGLSIEGGRLYVEHAKRGKILFSELSDGEAYKAAIPMYARALRQRAGADAPCVLVIGKQAAWQELQPAAKEALVEIARAERVLIYVAEAKDGPFRAEVLEPGAAA